MLMLLRSYEDETVRRVAVSAIANLAMNGNCSSNIIFIILSTQLFLIGVIVSRVWLLIGSEF